MKISRSSGILAHPTSFPSAFGIGDLGPSAYTFIDFLEKGKQSLWQILPLGPTSFGDSPYQSFSTFAGNPLLISPEMLIRSGLITKAIDIPNFLNRKIEYGNVIPFKNNIYRKAYENFRSDITCGLWKKFRLFCDENENWLDDFALFVSLKHYFIEKRNTEIDEKELNDFFHKTAGFLAPNEQNDFYFGAVWTTWPAEIAKREPFAMLQWKEKLKDEILYHKFLQFLFYSQWSDLKHYANSKGIKIIGDIPIFVAFDSADTWTNPDHFHTDAFGYPTEVAGVPPDYFSATGQLWGNPLYNWPVHKKNNYSWWISRMKNVLSTVDIVRIDHFRGFDAYWSIPFGDKDATGGRWQPGPGKELFEVIKKELPNLPVIAEDLGIITDSVTKLRLSLGFPGMCVLQFAFDGNTENTYLPHNYLDTQSVVYTGTHDNDTTNGWYEKASIEEKDLFRRYMNVSGESPSWEMIRLAISSTAAISIYPIQDIMCLGSVDRMNTPSVAVDNWMFRYTSDMLKTEDAEALGYLCTLFGRASITEEESKE